MLLLRYAGSRVSEVLLNGGMASDKFNADFTFTGTCWYVIGSESEFRTHEGSSHSIPLK